MQTSFGNTALLKQLALSGRSGKRWDASARQRPALSTLLHADRGIIAASTEATETESAGFSVSPAPLPTVA
ncbi:hypothetical protein N7532_003176 [Penicillium argentinense]|uniref:Uncharacterized protein n=1 Tax=Penicillium argentinense TaxID=1131581 RepID=A0A9W9KEZ6_9EURO|nr:uncharacterized protein N7532_003176 [Penicillium argentinense]KAJ5102647.1 hypothetical protein N7532_003176 [Penicillium argentinense]